MFITGFVAHLTALLILLLSGPVTFVRGSEVRGFLGQSVTLPCSYSVRLNGESVMCWGRGRCPAFACSETLVTTNGKTVTSKISLKYHLDGKIEEGDVSLTVDNLREEDSGWYCCRVEIPGIFNDQKMHFKLLVLEGSSPVTIPPFADVTHTPGHGNEISSYSNSLTASPTTRNSTLSPHSMSY
ncbi:hepatitis A virus cellular receptor 1 homolog isoform X2 [Scyliorhinus torazame]|uniref:hepatitis A virus cellular receptor 1 homolog isoform X2 n=1 Tax=Scyliorhinus torazame TaxID=75743 RepID=UPI003B5A2223